MDGPKVLWNDWKNIASNIISDETDIFECNLSEEEVEASVEAPLMIIGSTTESARLLALEKLPIL